MLGKDLKLRYNVLHFKNECTSRKFGSNSGLSYKKVGGRLNYTMTMMAMIDTIETLIRYP